MGCFNMFCAVSGAVIRYKDPVVVIGLNPTLYVTKQDYDFRDDDIWTDKNYQISSLPLFGVYNDYGGIDLDENQENNISLFLEKTSLEKRPHDKNKETAEIHNNNFRLMFIHRSVYDRMMSKREPYEMFFSGQRPLDWDAFEESKDKMKEMWELLGYDEKLGAFDCRVVLSFADTQFWEFCNVDTHKVPRDFIIELYQTDDPKNSTFVKWYETIKWIESVSHTIGFRIAPSIYAGQDATIADRLWIDEEIVKLREKERNWLDE